MDLTDGITHRGNDLIEDDRKRRKDRKPKKRVLVGIARKFSSEALLYRNSTVNIIPGSAIGRSVAPKTRSSPPPPIKEQREEMRLQLPPSIVEAPTTSVTQASPLGEEATTTRLVRR